MKKTVIFFLLMAMAGILSANNISISNLSLTGKNTTDHYTMVRFDISWENSWRTSTVESNWDAAWFFVKYRVAGGAWQHAWLDESGHTAPTGSTITPGLLTPGAAFNATANPGLGAFIYRSANGAASTFTKTGVELRWNYGANGVTDGDVVEIKVFAIEMVYVPQSEFTVGSGGAESGSFTNGSWTSGATVSLSIASESALTIAQSTGNLWGTSGSGNNTIGSAGTLAAAFPKGYRAFYCMKHEISQQGYVDFLNSLTETQASARYPVQTTNRFGISVASGVYSTANPYVSCNFLSWPDVAAYLDWSGLRPMTELEFEKACRGTATPVANEYAWGNATAAAANNITDGGAINETTNTSGANAVFNNQANVQGPLRTGVFATGASTRLQAGDTYYGIMEMSGNVWERPVTVGNETGRGFTGTHGDGMLNGSGFADAASWPDETGAGAGYRGGAWLQTDIMMRVSDRTNAALSSGSAAADHGGRGVRTQPLPTLTTAVVTDITSITATSGGNVTDDGGNTITARGVCWSTSTNPIATGSHTTETGTTGVFTSYLTGLTGGTLYYVRAYATTNAGTAYGNQVTFTTSAPVFTCGSSSIIVSHTAGPVAPVNKTTTYGTVTNIPGETSKCWITSNLGADHQATAKNDPTEPSAGWYWQFNRKQGYKDDGTVTPPWPNQPINENSDWLPANDPCALELGTGWRIPTSTEWTNVDASGGWSNWDGPWNSDLKLHAAGYIAQNGSRNPPGAYGNYWSSTQVYVEYFNTYGGMYLSFMSISSNMNATYKDFASSLRCINDN